MVMFWVSLLAISILLYVLLDGLDLGVGLLSGLASGEARRGAMLSASRDSRLACWLAARPRQMWRPPLLRKRRSVLDLRNSLP